MSKHRIYYPDSLNIGANVMLNSVSSVRVARVLRSNVGDNLVLFNGQGGEYICQIESIDKRACVCKVIEFKDRSVESPLKLILAQGISKGERMDYTIQKAVELGVNEIIPLTTARTTVNLNRERQQRRLEHWQGIVTSACEQCGRNTLPHVQTIMPFAQWLGSYEPAYKLVLDPRGAKSITQLANPREHSVTVLIGPEGGLSDQELILAQQFGFTPTRCGPRTLRTETAAVAVFAVLQNLWGDFS